MAGFSAESGVDPALMETFTFESAAPGLLSPMERGDRESDRRTRVHEMMGGDTSRTDASPFDMLLGGGPSAPTPRLHSMSTHTDRHKFGLPVVLDCGSGMLKAGMAGEAAPKVVFPSVLGRPTKDRYIGAETQVTQDILSLERPIERGVITQWDDMEAMWLHTFHKLDVTPNEHPVLLTEAPLNPENNREKMLQIMFETFGVQATYVAVQAVLSMYASGHSFGVAVECGHGVTQIVPVYRGYPLPDETVRLNMAGGDITQYLGSLLAERTDPITASEKVLCEMKEKLAYIALDYEKELKNMARKKGSNSKLHVLPDGKKIMLGRERFQCAEMLFNPALAGLESVNGVHVAVHNSISKRDAEFQRHLYSNIILSGGTAMLPGLADRMTKEIQKLSSTKKMPGLSVIVEKEPKYAVWIGGSVLASLSTFKKMWISKQEYEESGSAIVHRRTF